MEAVKQRGVQCLWKENISCDVSEGFRHIMLSLEDASASKRFENFPNKIS